ncbi:MAG: hypothetical protein L3J86_00395, partial [Thermoplasmata archaeon]|nr:hypothetical protein [Thermoplasmata archaeon]
LQFAPDVPTPPLAATIPSSGPPWAEIAAGGAVAAIALAVAGVWLYRRGPREQVPSARRGAP